MPHGVFAHHLPAVRGLLLLFRKPCVPLFKVHPICVYCQILAPFPLICPHPESLEDPILHYSLATNPLRSHHLLSPGPLNLREPIPTPSPCCSALQPYAPHQGRLLAPCHSTLILNTLGSIMGSACANHVPRKRTELSGDGTAPMVTCKPPNHFIKQLVFQYT